MFIECNADVFDFIVSLSLTAGVGDDMNPYLGEWCFSADYLINHDLIKQHPSIVEALQSLVIRKETKIVTENDLITHIFQYAEEHSRVRIYLFTKAARMFYSLMQNAVPPKDATLSQLKNPVVK